MRTVLILFLAALTLAPLAASAQDTRYLQAMPDIPLMPEMSGIRDSDVVFDKADGRIAEEAVNASGLTPDQVRKFYRETLPALGWTALPEKNGFGRFSRNGEQLIVNVEKLGSEGIVVFAVSPTQP